MNSDKRKVGCRSHLAPISPWKIKEAPTKEILKCLGNFFKALTSNSGEVDINAVKFDLTYILLALKTRKDFSLPKLKKLMNDLTALENTKDKEDVFDLLKPLHNHLDFLIRHAEWHLYSGCSDNNNAYNFEDLDSSNDSGLEMAVQAGGDNKDVFADEGY